MTNEEAIKHAKRVMGNLLFEVGTIAFEQAHRELTGETDAKPHPFYNPASPHSEEDARLPLDQVLQ